MSNIIQDVMGWNVFYKLHSECLRKINFVRFRDLGKGLTGVYKVKNANGTDNIVKALNTHNLECNPNLVTIRSEKNPPKNTPKLPPTWNFIWYTKLDIHDMMADLQKVLSTGWHSLFYSCLELLIFLFYY